MTDHILFAVEPTATRDATHAIYPMSLLFRSGEYKDKSFAMSGDEMRAAVANFKPVAGNIEHTDFLKGRACEVRRIWTDDEGQTLRGEVAVPLGLDALLEDHERKLSCEWHRDTKTLDGIALVTRPRVADAALLSEVAAAFSDNDPEEYIRVFTDAATFAGKRHSASDEQRIQAIHDHAEKLGAINERETPAQPPRGIAPQRKVRAEMSKNPIEKVLDYLHGTDYDKRDLAEFEAAIPPADAARGATIPVAPAVPLTPAPDPEKAAMFAEIERLRARDVERDAVAFADGEIAASRALPFQRAALIAAFTQAVADDARDPRTVTFGAGEQKFSGTRVEMLRAQQALQQPHALTTEMLRNVDAKVIFNKLEEGRTKPGEISEERRKELLGASPLGRAVLNK